MGSKIDSKIKEQLKQCSKDEASLSKLEELFGELYIRYERTAKELSLLEQAIKNDYDSILITELGLEKPGPKIVYVNAGFTKMTGYEKDEVIGKTPRILQGEKTDRKVLDRLKKRLMEGQAFFGHTVNYRKDGSEFINQWDIHPLTNSDGEITHWVSYQRDITERKESSKLVFDAKLDFDGLAEESRKTYVDLDVQGNILASNNAFKDILGFDADELKEKKFWELVISDDTEETKYFFSDFNPDNIEDKAYTWDFHTKDGDTVKLEADVNYFVKEDETIIRIHFNNISMRNRIIETLKRKKEQLQSILNKKDEFTLRFKKSGNDFNCSFASESFTDITGVSTDKVLNDGLEDVIHDEDIPKVQKAIDNAFKGNPSTIQCRYKTVDQNYTSIVQSFKPRFDSGGKEVESVKSVGLIELEVEQ